MDSTKEFALGTSTKELAGSGNAHGARKETAIGTAYERHVAQRYCSAVTAQRNDSFREFEYGRLTLMDDRLLEISRMLGYKEIPEHFWKAKRQDAEREKRRREACV